MHLITKISAVVLPCLLVCSSVFAQEQKAGSAQKKTTTDLIPVLIVDGQSGYHGDWPKITLMMKTLSLIHI